MNKPNTTVGAKDNETVLGRSRLDKFLQSALQLKKRDVQILLAQSRVYIDERVANNADTIIDRFSHICLDQQVLQQNAAHYVMLHKPVGVVSATKDTQHQTVTDLLPYPYKNSLHIVGRLDLNTSGLVLLTNDSRWSESITQPTQAIEKVYKVTLANPVTPDYIDAFANGMYFGFEDITTKPAKLEILSDYVCQVKLIEGRYHQIKRMFGRFQNPVVALHRSAIGNLVLDECLPVGQSRELTANEVANLCIVQ